MEFGIEKCAMLVMKSNKRHMTEGTTKSRSNQNDRRKRNLQIIGDISAKKPNQLYLYIYIYIYIYIYSHCLEIYYVLFYLSYH